MDPSAHFDAIYREGAPWRIGGVQPEVERLWAEGALRGRVLDVGCGTGENAAWLMAQGADVVGIDVSPLAIDAAREHGVNCEVADGTRPAVMRELAARHAPGGFDAVLDAGVFHVFDDPTRARYVEALAAALRPGGRVHVVVFSEHEPDWGGPRRVRADELHTAFDDWKDVGVVAATYRTLRGEGRAWRLDATRR